MARLASRGFLLFFVLLWLAAEWGTTTTTCQAAKIMIKPSDPYPLVQQVHIAYGELASEMVVMWSSAIEADNSSFVLFGSKPGAYTHHQVATNWNFTAADANPDGLQYLHRAVLTGLVPGQKYYYRAYSGVGYSNEYFFTAKREGNDWVPKLLVYGDMGKDGGAPTLPRLIREVATGDVTAIIHVGDFAYDLHDNGGVRGDQFMERIEPIAAYVPYMTCPGNHEIAYNFSHYRNRFSMPGARGNWSQNMWYSWDLANVHFIAYSSEVYFVNQEWLPVQKAWLEDDLRKANQNRNATPWIIAYGHRPMYCSNIDGDDCTTPRSIVRAGLEELFYRYGVDVIIEAHEHSYERLWPVFNETVTQQDYFNPQAPVHIISGAAGCNEQDGVCVNAILGPKGPWSAFRSWLPGLYGYGRLSVDNSTVLRWEQVYDITGSVEDAIHVVQHHHGQFPQH
jgi:hypothetical protein